MPLDLPPQFKQHIEEKIPQLRAQAQAKLTALQTFLGPLWAEFGPSITNGWAKLREAIAAKPTAPGSSGETVGGQFRHLLVVGLNRSEMLLQTENDPVWGESWQGMLDDALKRQTALIFFAPRDLDGTPSAPVPFLMGDGEDAPVSDAIPPALQGVAMLDFCRMPPAAPNTVNILIAADCLFHWDAKDTYVLPTTQTGWARDVEGVIRSYPRTTRVNVFTQWDATLLPHGERVKILPLRELPLEGQTWINEPTFQEKYGNHVLMVGIAVAILVGLGVWWQGRGVAELTDQLNIVQQQIPRGGQFSDLERAVAEQEKMFARRPLFALAVKDVHRAVQKSGLLVEEVELKVPDEKSVPDSYVLTLTMPTDAYNGWLQQEPIARSFLLNTAMVHAVRKPPSTAGFKLEGLVMLQPWLREYNRIKPQIPSALAPTLDVSAATPAPQPALPGEDGE